MTFAGGASVAQQSMPQQAQPQMQQPEIDPVSDAVRATTDGHIVLSRQLAERGVYPAIDVGKSISRVMRQVTQDEHRELAKMLDQRCGALQLL